MFTLDANIFARDFDPRDPDYAVCHALLDRLGQATTPVVMPLIILPEVGGAISRTFGDPIRARVYVDQLRSLPTATFVPLDMTLAQEAAEIAADYGLRGMNAIYVATARNAGTALVTLDDDVRRRVAAIITVQTPAEALSALATLED